MTISALNVFQTKRTLANSYVAYSGSLHETFSMQISHAILTDASLPLSSFICSLKGWSRTASLLASSSGAADNTSAVDSTFSFWVVSMFSVARLESPSFTMLLSLPWNRSIQKLNKSNSSANLFRANSMLKLIAKQAQRKLRTYATAILSCSPTQRKISTTRWTLSLICVRLPAFHCGTIQQTKLSRCNHNNRSIQQSFSMNRVQSTSPD